MAGDLFYMGIVVTFILPFSLFVVLGWTTIVHFARKLANRNTAVFLLGVFLLPCVGCFSSKGGRLYYPPGKEAYYASVRAEAVRRVGREQPFEAIRVVEHIGQKKRGGKWCIPHPLDNTRWVSGVWTEQPPGFHKIDSVKTPDGKDQFESDCHEFGHVADGRNDHDPEHKDKFENWRR